MPNLIKLTKPWAGNKPGATFEVLAPGENPRPGAVDQARAATLIQQQLATAADKPAAPAKKEA